MILLRLISWPYFRKHLLRWTLTVAGIVLGVAVFVGMHTANQSVLYAFNRTVDRIAGATQLHVTAGETGFDEEVLEQVQAVPEVRVAVPVIEAVVETHLRGQGSLLVLGVDMTGDRSLRDYDLESGDASVVDDPLVFLAQPDSLIITSEFAARNGLSSGSRIPLWTVAGEKSFTVRGIMRSGGLTSAFGGNLAIMDVYAAQLVFGRGRRFDRIDLALTEGVTLEQGQAAIVRALGPGLKVEPPSGRGQQFESIMAAFSVMVSISSLFALFIGMFIIYNSFAIAVTQRRSEIGILRALGATRRQVLVLFLGESAVTGLVGAVLGVAFGLLLARGIASYISDLLGQVYGVAERAEELAAEPWILVTALAIGIATSIVAATIPARSAARVDPVQALQKGRHQVLSAGENRARQVAAIVLGAISGVCLLFGSSRIVFYVGYLLVIVVSLLLTPMLALGLTRLLRPVLRWVRPVEGALAADSLIQSPRRTSASVAALMLSLAIAVAFGGMAEASYRSILDWVDTALNPDLFVTPSENLTNRTFLFPSSIRGELTQIDGVDDVQLVRSARIDYGGGPVMLVAVDVESLSRRTSRPPVQGDPSQMYRRTAAGEGLMVSDNLAQMRHLTVGDIIELDAPRGAVRLPLVGVVVDYSDQQGTILMDRSTYVKYWNDEAVNVARVYVKPGVSARDVRQRILDDVGKSRRVFVLTNEDVRSYILKVTEQWFGLTSVQIAVAVLVAILGIVNTLTVSIIDRRRELGVLQAVGGLRRQIRQTIYMEAMTIGIVGLVLGLGLGAVNLYYILEVVRNDVGGMRLDYILPFRVALLLVPTILGAALIAAIWPSEAAVRGSLIEALEYE